MGEPGDDYYKKIGEEGRIEYFKAWTEYVSQYSEALPDLTQLSSMLGGNMSV